MIPAGPGPEAEVADAGAALPVPQSVADLTPGWLAAALPGGLAGPVPAAVDCQPIGVDEGFTGGALWRVVLGCPPVTSVVVKLSPPAGPQRDLMARANAREVHVYRHLAPEGGLSAPDCHLARADTRTGASVLVLRDLTALRRVSFPDGCTVGDAEAVVGVLARMHARWWQSPALAALGPPGWPGGGDFAPLWQRYPQHLGRILPGVEVPAALLTLGQGLAARSAAAVDDARAPRTLLHGDLQVDNVLFGWGDPVLIDWQFCGAGAGATDLANFLISSLDPALRRREEARLLAAYSRALAEAGGTAPDPAALRAAYLRGAARKLALTVAATVGLDNATPARRAWRRCDLERLAAFCDDHPVVAMLST